MLASTTLTYAVYAVTMTCLQGIVARPISWRCTSKFKSRSRGVGAVQLARAELRIGGGLFLSAVTIWIVAASAGMVLMLLLGVLLHGLAYLAAPVPVLLADWELRRQSAPSVTQQRLVCFTSISSSTSSGTSRD